MEDETASLEAPPAPSSAEAARGARLRKREVLGMREVTGAKVLEAIVL